MRWVSLACLEESCAPAQDSLQYPMTLIPPSALVQFEPLPPTFMLELGGSWDVLSCTWEDSETPKFLTPPAKGKQIKVAVRDCAL